MLHRHTLAIAALGALAIAGCKARDEAAAVDSTAGAVSAAATPTASRAAAAPNIVTVHAKDFQFTAPDSIPAGMTTFNVMNDGPSLHHVTVLRLDDGKTVADLEAAMKQPGPPPSWVKFAGGPNAPDPGKEANATFDITPGNYAMVCFVDVPGGVPHFAKGMVHPLTVTAAKGPTAAAPVADDSITLSNYAFTISTPISAGKHTFMVHNTADQPHEIELIRLAPGKTPKDLLDWMQKPNGPPPGNAIGGVAAMSGSAPEYFSADVTPGQYLLICFLPDVKDGKPHFEHGMMHTFKVS